MLRLKGLTESGEWVKFEVTSLHHGADPDSLYIVRHTKDGPQICFIDPDTIQPAEDPRKQMLAEIRTRMYQEFDSNEHRFIHEVMTTILDEMEAKL